MMKQVYNLGTLQALYKQHFEQSEQSVIRECFKNVVRTNNSKKLSYCKPITYRRINNETI